MSDHLNASPPSPTRVSVVVPCLNEEQYIGVLIEALRRQSLGPDEVVLIEGGSTDATLDVIDAARMLTPHPPLRVLIKKDTSIPQKVNSGVLAAAGDVIVRFDAHSVPAPDYLARALSHLEDTAIGVVGGRWKIEPGRASLVARAIARAVAHPLGAGDAAYRTGNVAGVADVDTVPFGCFRKDVWKGVGGFDERLHTNEDYDFNYRVRRGGRRIVLDPAMVSTYFARPTLGSLGLQYFRYGWWKIQMLRKYPESLRWRQAVPAGFVATVIALALGTLISGLAGSLLAVVLACYGATVTGVSISVCVREGDWRRLGPLCCAFATVHVCWGLGAMLNLLTAARWPYSHPASDLRVSSRAAR